MCTREFHLLSSVLSDGTPPGVHRGSSSSTAMSCLALPELADAHTLLDSPCGEPLTPLCTCTPHQAQGDAGEYRAVCRLPSLPAPASPLRCQREVWAVWSCQTSGIAVQKEGKKGQIPRAMGGEEHGATSPECATHCP